MTGIRQSPMDCAHKGSVIRNLYVLFVVCLTCCWTHSRSSMPCFDLNVHVTPLSGNIRSAWWCHQMETFSALLALCAGNSPVTGEFPSPRPVTRSFNVICDLHLDKCLSKQSRGWWFEIPSPSLLRHYNGLYKGRHIREKVKNLTFRIADFRFFA